MKVKVIQSKPIIATEYGAFAIHPCREFNKYARTIGDEVEYVFEEDLFLRWKIDGILRPKTLVVLAQGNSLIQGSPYTTKRLTNHLNGQLAVPYISESGRAIQGDGIYFFNNDSVDVGVSKDQELKLFIMNQKECIEAFGL